MTPTATIALPLRGQVIVVTGASDGIGRAAVEQLSARGAELVMVGRNLAKTTAAAQAIMSATGERNVAVEIADLSSQHETRELARRLRDRYPKIHVLINNAGAIFADRRLTAEGLERTFALNHLAYFTLTLELLGSLQAAATPGRPARVIVVSSRAHVGGHVDFANLQGERRFRSWRAYGTSKLENLLFTRALARRLDPTRVVVHALHPGVVATRFAVSGNGRWGRAMRWVMNVVSISVADGADTMVWLATAPDAIQSSGRYWVNRRETSPSREARNDAVAEQLWAVSAVLAHLDTDAVVAEAAR